MGTFFTTGVGTGNLYAIVKLTLRWVPEQKVLKTWYTCSARSRTGSTTTALTSRLTTRFRVCIGREKQKHCTPVQPTLGPAAPPLHYSPDSQHASESASTEKKKKRHCTPVQPSLREVAPLPHSQYASESVSTEKERKDTVHLFSQVSER